MTDVKTQDVAGLSDLGRRRAVNEDAFLIDHELSVYAVADGMGGHGAGDVASQLTVSALKTTLQQHLRNAKHDAADRDDNYRQITEDAISIVNKRVFDQNLQEGFAEGTGMGTTLVGLCQIPAANRAIVFNVGDSRLYQFRQASLTQITRDHTLYQDWQDADCIGPAPPKNIILRALGLYGDVDVDFTLLTLEANDCFILCSDGLTGMVDDAALLALLKQHEDRSAQQLCAALIALANRNGGFDNVTVIAIKLGQGPE